MAKVEWSRLSGDECEGVLGVLLLRRHPHARRIRPSQGDRGVDVYAPGDDGWTVFQIKSFTGALTPSHKRQITKSWTRFVDLVQERQLKVVAWHLLRPENPTFEDENFLADLTSDAAWPCGWMGLDHCDELAASYPDVIDYYLRDGKERLDNTVRQHLTAAGFANRTESDPIEAEASVPTLQAIHDAINSIDPHYRYDFAVLERPSNVAVDDPDWPPRPHRPDLVASAIRHEAKRVIVFNIFCRFDQAVEERPVPISFKAIADVDSPEGRAWKDFLDFGVATKDLVPVVDLVVDLPGGLGAKSERGLVRVGPAAPDRTVDWTVTILGPDADVIASLDLQGGQLSPGVSGRGSSLSLVDSGEAIELEFRVDHTTSEFNYTLRHLPLFGKAPRSVLPGIRFAAAFHAPNSIELAPAGGPALSDPMPLSGSANPAFDRVLNLLELLATIQRHTLSPLVLPQPDRLAVEAPQWDFATRLLRGETLHGTWKPMAVPFDAAGGRPSVGDVIALELTGQLAVTVDGGEIQLGNVIETYPAAKVDRVDLRDGSEDTITLYVSPLDDSSCSVRLAAQSE